MRRLSWISFFFSVLGVVSSFAADAVYTHLNVRHSVEGKDRFDRSRYITMHAGIDDNEWDSVALRDQFLEDYDVYLGRNNGAMPWHLSQTTEDPGKAGWPNLGQMETRGQSTISAYANDVAGHKHESRGMMMFGGQMSMFPNNRDINPPQGELWQLEGYEAFAEYYSGFLTHFFGEGGTDGEPKPTYVEVLNEPFVAAHEYGTTRQAVADVHVAVARRLQETHPDVLVGGYTAAHPMFEAAGFNHWNNNWKFFIDEAGEDMDFFSVHLYDFRRDPNDAMQYRVGSNVEAILDMIEAYSMIALGEVKPFVISEYGFFSPGDHGTAYSKQRDWGNVRSFSSILMGLMEKPHLMEMTMPFSILKANWYSHESGEKYPYRLFRQKEEVPGQTGLEWEYTELVQFYQLWSEVNGVRVDTTSSDPDLQVDAYVEGETAFLILNNLEYEARVVDLKFFGGGRVPVVSVSAKHSYADEAGAPVLEEVVFEAAPASVELAAEGTMILKYAFEEELVIDQMSEETKHYAKTYFQSIAAGTEIGFEIDGVSTSEFGEATLRLGLGRDHGMSLKPTLMFNGEAVEVVEDWRGFDQNTRDRFFGVLEIPIPHRLIEEDNEVAVTFSDAGGHVTSVALQVWEFSERFRGDADEAFEGFGHWFDAGEEDLVLETFGKPGQAYTVMASEDVGVWTATGETQEGTGRPLEFRIDAEGRKMYRIRAADSVQ